MHELIPEIEYATAMFLETDQFAEAVPLHTFHPPPDGLLRNSSGQIHPPAGGYTTCTPPIISIRPYNN